MIKQILFEVGVEELPARFIDDAQTELYEKTKKWLRDSRISFEEVTTFSTPRRLAVIISNVSKSQKTISEEVRGPALKIAKNEAGEWTKAAIGFTKGQGLSTDDIYLKKEKDVEYIFVEKTIEGQPTKEILPEFEKIISSLHFKQTMRWGDLSYKFARPIRWLVALADQEIIPFEIANVVTGRKTRGHRFLGKQIELSNASEYEQALEENYCIPNPKKREEMIVRQLKELEDENKFNIIIDPELLIEVRNLVEYPTAFYGSYEDHFLSLPSEVLITSMKEHQRYFPVVNEEKELLPHFVSVRNGDDQALENVAAGNEKVLRARLSDGEFFYEEDQKNSIDFYLEKMETVVYQEKIGTLAEKVNKVTAIAKEIGHLLEVDHDTAEKIQRAAAISKFDLMTDMVNEFPELQGVMGEKYALILGEDKAVAEAVKEHYLPAQANGKLPKSIISTVVSIADKLDTVISSISVGLTPSGSQDPYGLRRQALGVLRIVEEKEWDIRVEELLAIVENIYQIEDETLIEKIKNFFRQRVQYLFTQSGLEQDIVKSVTNKNLGNLAYAHNKAVVLSHKRNDKAFKPVQEALVRILNLKTKDAKSEIDEKLFETESEKALFAKYQEVKKSFRVNNIELKAEDAFDNLTDLTDFITAFFDNNMVMTEDIKVRENRLCLVESIATIIKEYADLTVIEWNQSFN